GSLDLSEPVGGTHYSFLHTGNINNGAIYSLPDVLGSGVKGAEVAGLNNKPAVVGTAFDAAGASRIFVWSPTPKATPLFINPLPGHPTVRAAGINDKNEVVGFCGTDDSQGLLYSGQTVDLGKGVRPRCINSGTPAQIAG